MLGVFGNVGLVVGFLNKTRRSLLSFPVEFEMAKILFFAIVFFSSSIVWAQRGPTPQTVVKNPQAVGEEGVAWYTTWDTALTEAQRSNRPIFFMSAAAQCSGVSGVF